jgi:hypothetical protein
MTRSNRNPEDRRLRRKTAAYRLKHDVGKALRWSAPEEREKDAAALRTRLAADLLPQPGGVGTRRDVVKSFFEWKRDEGPLFATDDPDLQAVERAMATIASARPELLSLEGISFSSLCSLDSACEEASRACTSFYRRVAVEDGPEIVRPLGPVHGSGGRT